MGRYSTVKVLYKMQATIKHALLFEHTSVIMDCCTERQETVCKTNVKRAH